MGLRCLSGRTGKAEDAKLPGVGIIPEAVPNGEGGNGDNAPEESSTVEARTRTTEKEETNRSVSHNADAQRREESDHDTESQTLPRRQWFAGRTNKRCSLVSVET
jgi:hypothetical protein